MMSCEQPEKHEAQVVEETEERRWKKVIELFSNITAFKARLKRISDMGNKHQTQRELQRGRDNKIASRMF